MWSPTLLPDSLLLLALAHGPRWISHVRRARVGFLEASSSEVGVKRLQMSDTWVDFNELPAGLADVASSSSDPIELKFAHPGFTPKLHHSCRSIFTRTVQKHLIIVGCHVAVARVRRLGAHPGYSSCNAAY